MEDTKHNILDTNCSLTSRSSKEGIWIKGLVNNVEVDIFVDTGAKHTLIDFDFWNKVCTGKKFRGTSISLVGAGGKALSVIGEGECVFMHCWKILYSFC